MAYCPICKREVEPAYNDNFELVCPHCGYVFGYGEESFTFVQYTINPATGKRTKGELPGHTIKFGSTMSSSLSKKEKRHYNSNIEMAKLRFGSEIGRALDEIADEYGIVFPTSFIRYAQNLAVSIVEDVYKETEKLPSSIKSQLLGGFYGLRRHKAARMVAEQILTKTASVMIHRFPESHYKLKRLGDLTRKAIEKHVSGPRDDAITAVVYALSRRAGIDVDVIPRAVSLALRDLYGKTAVSIRILDEFIKTFGKSKKKNIITKSTIRVIINLLTLYYITEIATPSERDTLLKKYIRISRVRNALRHPEGLELAKKLVDIYLMLNDAESPNWIKYGDRDLIRETLFEISRIYSMASIDIQPLRAVELDGRIAELIYLYDREKVLDQTSSSPTSLSLT